MKKHAFFCLALVIMILLCSCAPRESAPTEEPEKLIRVGFSQTGAESVWRVANTESIKTALSEENGYELIFSDGQQQQEKQTRAIRTFIQQKVDYIVLAPLVESGWDTVLEEAAAAKIPVIIVDRMIKTADDSLYTAYVGSNFLQEGRTAVSWLEDALAKYRHGGTVNIVNIQGTLGSSAQLGRSAALDEGLAAHPEWKLVARSTGNFIKPQSYEVMREILKTTRDIDVAYCENDSAALGAIKALEEAGLRCGIDKDVIVISFDASGEGLNECLTGRISLDVECNPLQGTYVSDIIQRLNRFEKVEKITYLQETSFDCLNITKAHIALRSY